MTTAIRNRMRVDPTILECIEDPLLRFWGTQLTTLSRIQFTNCTLKQIQDGTPPCVDTNGIIDGINPHHVEHFCYGKWQCSFDTGECMTGMFKILNIRPTSSFLSQPALDSILNHGHMPDEWKSQRHFGRDKEHPGPLHIPRVTGIWHNGDNHFVVVYICPTYWTIIDPLYDHPNTRSTMNANIRSALHKAYNTKGLPRPSLPNYRPIHKIATQNDGMSGAWSCGTYAMLTTLHIVLSDKRPDQLQPNSISRGNMTNFHEALLHWYILGIPPDLWDLQCLS